MSDSVSRPFEFTMESVLNYLSGIESLACSRYQHTGEQKYLSEALDARIAINSWQGRKFGNLSTLDAESAALREEIRKLTLLSDSQLANQERLTEELAQVPAQILEVMGSFCDEPISIKEALDFLRQKREGYESWSAQAEAKVIALRAELATERDNQERLVGEMQELRQVVKEYRDGHRKLGHCGCSRCIKVDSLLKEDGE